MEAAHQKHNPSDEARLDAEFHMVIIGASHHAIMLHVMRSVFDLLRQGVVYNRLVMFRDRMTRDKLQDQHRAINAAVEAHDPVEVRGAVVSHLAYVGVAYRDQLCAEKHETIARRRLEHDTSR